MSAAFQMVCLAKPVLETALAALNDLKGDKLELKSEYVVFFKFFFVSLSDACNHFQQWKQLRKIFYFEA